jgi:hypothetical protein
MDDLTIKKDVEAELQWEPSVNAAAIGGGREGWDRHSDWPCQ